MPVWSSAIEKTLAEKLRRVKLRYNCPPGCLGHSRIPDKPNNVTEPRLYQCQQEPRWQPHLPFSPCGASERLLDWLLDPTSLTQRLKQTCSGQFRVVPVSQTRRRPQLNEAIALGVNPHEVCFIREVHLLCDEQPWVFARTIIPIRTLSGPQRRLSRLGKKPLGAVLFADPSMQRSHIEIARICPGQGIFDTATAPLAIKPAEIWGRRSAFFLGGKPLLVSEIFLPEIGYGSE
ncbi:chorismate--pyruvate lyase family protein [Kaarinaea lacus]